MLLIRNLTRARSRLALPQAKDVRVTMEVKAGVFSKPRTVQQLDLGSGKVLPGGGTERTALRRFFLASFISSAILKHASGRMVCLISKVIILCEFLIDALMRAPLHDLHF
jgi:hypothetical protein